MKNASEYDYLKKLFMIGEDKPIVFENESGVSKSFKKRGVVPSVNYPFNFYYVLTPIEPKAGEEDVLIVCNSKIDDTGEIVLFIEKDEKVCEEILERYKLYCD